MKTFVYECEQTLASPIDEVFAFFADAHNLEVITPRWLHFDVLTPRPIDMKVGPLIDYRLRWRGVPLKWQTEIMAWEPTRRFVDRQKYGPYRKWVHTHSFTDLGGGVTHAHDRVEYAVPLPWLTHRFFVRPDVERIFAHRRKVLAERFGDTTRRAPVLAA